MKTLLLATVMTVANAFIAIGQGIDPNYEIHYRKVESIQTDDINIEIIDNHCQASFCQVKFKITNKTKNYIVLKAEDLKFVFEHNTYVPETKNIVVEPFKTTSKSVRVTGDSQFQVEKYQLQLTGFYVVPVDGTVAKMDKFKLPAATNTFKTEVFTCKVNGEIIKETKVTEVPVKCKYSGNSIAIVDQSKPVLVLESGQEFATENRGKFAKMVGSDNILFPGEDKKVRGVFRVPGKIEDMQFANMEIDWKDTFIESKLVLIELPTQKFEKDLGLTEGKN